MPEVWSYGHRNPQGMTLHPITGELWEHQHGPQGGDEERLLDDRDWRVRFVTEGPKGFLYIGIDDGMILRLRPE